MSLAVRTPPMLEPKHHALLDEAARRGLTSADDIGLCFQLLSLANAIDRDCAARLAPQQLSEGKFVLLFLLHDQADGLSAHQLADGAGVTRATITGLLDGLERDGFVLREPGQQDRRRVMVTLTAKGKSVAATLFKEHTDWIGSLFGGLAASDKARLSDLLARVWVGTDTGRAALRKEPQ